MTRIVLISCAATKAPTARAARDLYTSDLFKKARRHAEQQGSEYYILSAKHGLVDPAEVLAPYNQKLDDMTREDREAWARGVIDQLSLMLIDRGLLGRSSSPVTLEIYAGATYADAIADCKQLRRNWTVTQPLAGKQIGQRLSWYRQAIEAHAQPSLFAQAA